MSLMMMKTNPITPPPEVVDRLFMIEGSEEDRIIAAYRAGADQELEAMLAELKALHLPDGYAARIRAARRPKPPSLKEQALKALTAIEGDFNTVGDRADTIRRAIEQLPD
jgi:hypothetical protein